MDLKAICRIIGSGIQPTAENEIDTLQKSIAQMMLNLGAAIPGQSELFTELVANMNRTITQTRAMRRFPMDVNTYFRASGPIARKLKEHMAVADWYDENANNMMNGSANPRIDRPHPSMIVFDHLQAFDFQPSNDLAMVKSVNDFLGTLRGKLVAQMYATTRPALPPGGQLHITPDMQSGIYGDGADPENVALILRGAYPDSEMQVLFYLPPNGAATLWFYHPYEMCWINSDWQMTFIGTLRLLEHEFEKAVEHARPMEREFDFSDELGRLEKQAHGIFDNEEVLPASLFCYTDGIAVHPVSPLPPLSTYVRKADASEITITTDKIHLIFRNTKGAYPMRSRQLCKKMAHLSTKVEPEDMSRPMQENMVHKTGYVLAVIGDIIRSNN